MTTPITSEDLIESRHYGSMLWDPHSNAMLSLGGPSSFVTYVRRRTTSKGMSRIKLEALREKILASILLESPDPSFPKSHHNKEFNEDYRYDLDRWEKKFKTLLSHSNCSHFKLL